MWLGAQEKYGTSSGISRCVFKPQDNIYRMTLRVMNIPVPSFLHVEIINILSEA